MNAKRKLAASAIGLAVAVPLVYLSGRNVYANAALHFGLAAVIYATASPLESAWARDIVNLAWRVAAIAIAILGWRLLSGVLP